MVISNHGAIVKVYDHETATCQVTGGGVSHSQGKTDGNRSVNRVPPLI